MILFCQLFFTDFIEAEVNSLNFQKLHDTYILAGSKLRPFTIQNNKISAAFQAKTADLSSRSRWDEGGTNLALNSRVCQESTMYILHQKKEYKAGTSEKEMVFISGPAHLYA